MRFRQLLPLFALLASLASAQVSSVRGRVSDAQSVPISDVTVTLTAPAEAGRRLATTNAAGEYSFSDLKTGTFQLIFSRAGYETATQSGTALGGEVEVNATLPVAGEVTSIDVTDVAGKATASRLDIPDRELPVQISFIPRQILQQQAVNNMVDALKNASGVQAFRWYGVYEYYTIRGFNQADLYMVDGMRLEGNRFNTQLNNVENVEVLKGPTSVLYGGGALGGVINVIRKKPQGTRAYDLMYRGGRFNSNQFAGGATGPLYGSRLLYRLDASVDHTNGWRRAGSDRLNVSPTLTWLMSERSRVTVHQAFNRDRFDGDGGVPINLTTLPNYRTDWRFNLPQDNALVEDSQTHILFNANLNKTWEFRDGFLTRRTSDRYFVTETMIGDPANNQVRREALDFHHTRRPVLNQADLIGRLNFLGMHHTLLAGHEYQDFFTRTDVTKGNDPTCNCGSWVNLPPLNLTTLTDTAPRYDTTTVYRMTYQANQINAGYWQDQIDVRPNLKINVAGRFDNYNRAVHRIFTSAPDVRTGIQARHQTAYTYRAGIVYTPFSTHQLYFNTATSFTPVTTVPANGAELNPQRGLTYEVGHRWKGWRNRIDTNLAFYMIDRDGQTIQTSQTTVAQVGSQKSRGADFDVNMDLGWGTRLLTNYGYAQSYYDDPGGSLNTRIPRFVPKHTGNLWLRKQWASGFSASIGSRYVGWQFANNNNRTRIGGYNVFSGAVGYRTRAWEWSLNADNLFNRGRYFLPGQLDSIVFPGQPINVSTTLRWHFN